MRSHLAVAALASCRWSACGRCQGARALRDDADQPMRRCPATSSRSIPDDLAAARIAGHQSNFVPKTVVEHGAKSRVAPPSLDAPRMSSSLNASWNVFTGASVRASKKTPRIGVADIEELARSWLDGSPNSGCTMGRRNRADAVPSFGATE